MHSPTPKSVASILLCLLIMSLAIGPATVQAGPSAMDTGASAGLDEAVARVDGCPGAPAKRLALSGDGMVRNNSIRIRVRNAPAGATVNGYVSGGDTFDVIGGAQCAKAGGQNYWWWQISVHGKSLTGWVPEASPWSYWLWPYPGSCTGAPAQKLEVGEQGIASGNGIPIRVRDKSASPRVVGYLYRGQTFDVLEGPECGDPGDGINYAWWQIKVHGTNVQGWVPEASPRSRWLTPYPGS